MLNFHYKQSTINCTALKQASTAFQVWLNIFLKKITIYFVNTKDVNQHILLL